MQGREFSQVVLFYSDLRAAWPRRAAAALHRALPYGKRLATDPDAAAGRASLAGIALALQALGRLTGRSVAPRELSFREGAKPCLRGGPDFSISHAGPWVGCAATARGELGFDVECARPDMDRTLRLVCRAEELAGLTPEEALRLWTAKEAALKAASAGVRDVAAVQVSGPQVSFRGRLLHRRDLDVFADAAACIVTSLPAPALEIRRLPLDAIFVV